LLCAPAKNRSVNDHFLVLDGDVVTGKRVLILAEWSENRRTAVRSKSFRTRTGQCELLEQAAGLGIALRSSQKQISQRPVFNA